MFAALMPGGNPPGLIIGNALIQRCFRIGELIADGIRPPFGE
jgi:hypothetical protein